MRLSEDEQKLVAYLSNLSVLQKLVAIIYYFAFVPPVVILATKLTELFGFTEFLHAGSYGLYFFLTLLIALLILIPIIVAMLWILLVIMSISDVQIASKPASIRGSSQFNNDRYVPVGQLSLNGVFQRPQLVWSFRPSAARSMNNPSLAAFSVPTAQFSASKFVHERQSQPLHKADLSRLFMGYPPSYVY